MKIANRFLAVLSAVVFGAMVSSCAGAATTKTDAEIAAEFNKKIEKLVVEEYSFGDRIALVKDVKTVAPDIKKVVDDPEFKKLAANGYSLFIVGHGCTWGDDVQNNAQGLYRAKQVMDEIRSLGTDMQNVKASTLGKTIMVQEQSTQHPLQRRVSFKVAKAVGVQ